VSGVTAATGGGPYDLVGIGLGPFNLSLAALADGLPGLRTMFVEQRPAFSWHPGLLLEGTTVQVPFLADLVTLVDPTSRWSFLSYLREHDRLFRFYFYERFHVLRREYDDYCRWVAGGLDSTRFGTAATGLRWDPGDGLFQIDLAAAEAGAAVHGVPAEHGAESRSGRRDGARGEVRDPVRSRPRPVTARNVVLGIGTEPAVPAALRGLLGPDVFHVADYRSRRDGLVDAGHVTVVGSGQSGAEAFLDLLRLRPDAPPPGAPPATHWLTRSPAFAPMEYSKLGLEHFTPDYMRFFGALPESARRRIVADQWQLYKGIGIDTIAEIYDLLYERSLPHGDPGAVLAPNVEVAAAGRRGGRIVLDCRHALTGGSMMLTTDRVVLATGHVPRRAAVLDPIAGLIRVDAGGSPVVDERFRVATAPSVTGGIYSQNGEPHTHGVGTPDLGLGAWRAAVILDDLTGGKAYRLPRAGPFTRFDVTAAGGCASGTGAPGTGASGGAAGTGASGGGATG
jgi:lysine N6-hydroxylase